MAALIEGPGRILEGVPEVHRRRIVEGYRARGGTFAGAWGRTEWAAIAEAIFAVENQAEHDAVRAGGTPTTSKRCRAALAVVADLRERRNRLLDALGENEVRPSLERARKGAA